MRLTFRATVVAATLPTLRAFSTLVSAPARVAVQSSLTHTRQEEHVWRAAAEQQRLRVRQLLGDELLDARHHENMDSHPLYNFLFHYYSFVSNSVHTCVQC
jgi:hypothetical protein